MAQQFEDGRPHRRPLVLEGQLAFVLQHRGGTRGSDRARGRRESRSVGALLLHLRDHFRGCCRSGGFYDDQQREKERRIRTRPWSWSTGGAQTLRRSWSRRVGHSTHSSPGPGVLLTQVSAQVLRIRMMRASEQGKQSEVTIFREVFVRTCESVLTLQNEVNYIFRIKVYMIII